MQATTLFSLSLSLDLPNFISVSMSKNIKVKCLTNRKLYFAYGINRALLNLLYNYSLPCIIYHLKGCTPIGKPSISLEVVTI